LYRHRGILISGILGFLWEVLRVLGCGFTLHLAVDWRLGIRGGICVLLRGFYWNLKPGLEFGRFCLVSMDQVF
jgi:hypothetical protein